jgi:hypothetical protein
MGRSSGALAQTSVLPLPTPARQRHQVRCRKGDGNHGSECYWAVLPEIRPPGCTALTKYYKGVTFAQDLAINRTSGMAVRCGGSGRRLRIEKPAQHNRSTACGSGAEQTQLLGVEQMQHPVPISARRLVAYSGHRGPSCKGGAVLRWVDPMWAVWSAPATQAGFASARAMRAWGSKGAQTCGMCTVRIAGAASQTGTLRGPSQARVQAPAQGGGQHTSAATAGSRERT